MSTGREKLLRMPRPVSRKHPPMPMADRAAQFAPFQALTGYGNAISEANRVTVQRLELSESMQDEIKRKLDWLQEHVSEHPYATIIYFCPDKEKDGGMYITASGKVKKLDEWNELLILDTNSRIRIKDIAKITMEGKPNV